MYIAYRTSNGKTYAYVAESVREGQSVDKKYLINLGRVLDKDKGIYRNRERGVYTYDIDTGSYGKVEADFVEPPKRTPGRYVTVAGKKRSRLCIEFGNIFFLDSFLKKKGLYKIIDATGYGNPDTVRALVFYYILSPQSNAHAADWYELSYTRCLFPHAAMSSQRVSEALAGIGLEDAKRSFFSVYYPFIRKCTVPSPKDGYGMAASGEKGDGILIDSSGLPNSARLPVTAISNHNGDVNNEARLIYVVQQDTGLPLFFSYVAGNVIDASTIKNVVAHLKNNGIATKFAILDAGYYNKRNADALIDAKISFITRVHANFKLFKDVVSGHRKQLECRENFITYNGRFYYIKRVACRIGEHNDKGAYAYLGLDVAMRDQQKSGLRSRMADEGLNDGDIYDSMNGYGLFMLVATRPVAVDKVLSLYYTRNQIEEVFGVGKGNGKLLPLRIATEDTFRGHLLITFIVSVVLMLLRKEIKHADISVESLFEELRHQQGIVYDDAIVPSVAVKKMNDIYKLFKMQCPSEIALKEGLPVKM